MLSFDFILLFYKIQIHLHTLRVLSPNLVFCTCNWGNKNIGDTKSPRMMEAEKVRNSKSLAKCIYQGTRILKGLGKQMEFQWSWDWSDLSATLALCLKKGNIYGLRYIGFFNSHRTQCPLPLFQILRYYFVFILNNFNVTLLTIKYNCVGLIRTMNQIKLKDTCY